MHPVLKGVDLFFKDEGRDEVEWRFVICTRAKMLRINRGRDDDIDPKEV